MCEKNCAKIAPSPKTGLQENFAEVENIGKMRVFHLGQIFGRRAFKQNLTKFASEIALNQKTGHQKKFGGLKNIGKMRGFLIGQKFRR